MHEINQVEMQLKENEINNRLAIYKLLPAEHRKMFLKRCCDSMCPMEPGMGGPGMGEGMGMNMGMAPMQVKVTREINTDRGESEEN